MATTILGAAGRADTFSKSVPKPGHRGIIGVKETAVPNGVGGKEYTATSLGVKRIHGGIAVQTMTYAAGATPIPTAYCAVSPATDELTVAITHSLGAPADVIAIFEVTY